MTTCLADMESGWCREQCAPQMGTFTKCCTGPCWTWVPSVTCSAWKTPFLEGYLKKYGGLHHVSAPGGPLLPLNPLSGSSSVLSHAALVYRNAYHRFPSSSTTLITSTTYMGLLLQLRVHRQLSPLDGALLIEQKLD